jgi:hypothetical protein
VKSLLQFCIACAVLPCALVGCQPNTKTDGHMLPDVSVGVDAKSNIQDATRICERAATISKKRPGKFEECISSPDTMVEDLERQFLNALQKNPACKGVTIFVVQSDAKTEDQAKLLQAKYLLHFHLAVTKEGYADMENSEWRAERMADGASVYGSMSNIEQETAGFCAAVRGEGGSVR